MNLNVQLCVWIPFLGTSLGAMMALFIKNELNKNMERILTGFAAGVMVAASIWSLLIPSMEQAKDMGKWSVLPATAGFWIGILFLLALDIVVPHLHRNSEEPEGLKSSFSKTTKLVLAVTLHNIPEGMAVGVVAAGWLSGNKGITFSAALVLAIGIAIQNFPEGAIISIPLRASGTGRIKASVYGILSGIVEPIGALVTIALAKMMTPVLPYLLGFAAGAMIYVVVEELIPEMSEEPHSNTGTIAFTAGFTLMMVLDVALG